MTATAMRVGVLTGGGDCPGLNAVIRAIGKTCHYDYPDRNIEIVGIRDGFLGLITGRASTLSDADISGILPRGGTILGSSNRDNPFDFCGEVDGTLVRGDVSDIIHKNMKDLRLDALVVIGGDGTLSIAQRFHEQGLPMVGVPKTIDNDLAATDQTFGFDTAVGVATEAIDRIHTTAASHHRAMVIEVMGRYAGWIALAAGLAGGGDVILLPEIPFDIEHVAEKVMTRLRRGKEFSIIVVAEGAFEKGKDRVYYRSVATGAEKGRLGGISNHVASAIEAATGLESRVTILGHTQRGGSPTSYDRILGTRLGVHAAHLAVGGEFGTMASLRGTEIVTVTLEEATREPRRVDPNGERVRQARAVGTSFGDDR